MRSFRLGCSWSTASILRRTLSRQVMKAAVVSDTCDRRRLGELRPTAS